MYGGRGAFIDSHFMFLCVNHAEEAIQHAYELCLSARLMGDYNIVEKQNTDEAWASTVS